MNSFYLKELSFSTTPVKMTNKRPIGFFRIRGFCNNATYLFGYAAVETKSNFILHLEQKTSTNAKKFLAAKETYFNAKILFYSNIHLNSIF
jgi:hypothetical protein